MNNAPSIKSLKTDSPKTPGGISKSLLTPCRRLGLSRNYKKAGPVPFISPISGNDSPKVEVQIVKKEPRKRKKSIGCEENIEESETTPKTPTIEEGIIDVDKTELSKPVRAENDELTSTPTRHLSVPCKKKSKTLLSALGTSKTPLVESQPVNGTLETSPKVCTDKAKEKNVLLKKSKSEKSLPRTTSQQNAKLELNDDTFDSDSKQERATKIEANVTPLQKTRAKSNSNLSKKIIASEKSPLVSNENYRHSISQKNVKENDKHQESPEEKTTYSIKPRSPNDLTKECIVVIQKKIFKTDKNEVNDHILITQDSDSDVPLCELNKEKNRKCNQKSKKDSKEQLKPAPDDNEIINLDEEHEDFVETKKEKVKKLYDKATSIGGLKKKAKIDKPKPKLSKPQPSVTDFDDEDDFDFDNKKTILIRKTYEKVSKPQKARSTGSITQRDIDELKARIEAKKKLLIARAVTDDTEELRSLIKKWQKGCQDALMELMDLMKTKFPDKQNMDYSEMLSMLKIPTNLVGYDEENDCFNTPDDANIVLSKFNDL